MLCCSVVPKRKEDVSQKESRKQISDIAHEYNSLSLSLPSKEINQSDFSFAFEWSVKRKEGVSKTSCG